MTDKVSNSNCRLWIVTEVYYPEEISTGYYLTSIAEGLAAHREVKVLCGQPNYAARGTIAPKHEFRNGVEIVRAASTTLDKNVIFYRVINMLTLGASMFLKSLKHFRRGDHVMVVTAPPSLPFTTGLAALMRGAGYTLLLHDCYPEQLIALGTSKYSLTVKAIDFANRWLFKHPSKIIVVGRDMKELVEKKTTGFDIPIDVIPNWASLEIIKPTPRNENPLLIELGLSDKFVLLNAGNFGRPTDIETVVDAAEKLLDRPQFHFLFIGSGAKRKWIEEQIQARKLANVTLLGPRPRDEQIIFLNACDVGLVTLVKGMWGLAMPSRTYNFLAAGKPILALTENKSEIARVIDEEKVGRYVEPGEPDEMVKTILEMYENRDELQAMSERAYAAAISKYSLQTAVENYRKALAEF